MAPDPLSTPPRIAPWHWALPFLVAAMTAPLWLGLYEPGVFFFLNRQLMVVPDIVWSLFSLLGTGWAVYALTSPALWRSPRIIVSWLCAAPLAGLLTRMGKMWAFSPRPLEVLGSQGGIHVIGEPLFVAAMPSGHSLTAFAAATAIYFSLAPQGRHRFLWLFGLAFGVGLSRVAVGAHWPADVSVGAALGILSGLTGAWLCSLIKAPYLQPQSWLMRGVGLFGLYCLYVLVSDEMGFAINRPYQYVVAAFLAVCLAVFVFKTLQLRTLSDLPVPP
jgi:membrane-associated phospholipid phosphatase